MGIRQVLEVDTKRFCLLCLNTTDSLTVLLSQNSVSKLKGFKQFLRYLKLNPKELLNCSSAFLESMNINEDVDVQVNLCSGCSSEMEKFDKLHRQYEIIRHQFDTCVQSVYKGMEEGNKDSERVREYKKEMLPTKSTEFVNASIAANLRNETFKKCAVKLKYRGPRVALQNIGNQTQTNSSVTFMMTQEKENETTCNTNRPVTDCVSDSLHTTECNEDQVNLTKCNNDIVPHPRVATRRSNLVEEPCMDENKRPANNVDDDNDDGSDTGGSNVTAKAYDVPVPEKTASVCEFCSQQFRTNELKSKHQLSVHSHDLICQALPPGTPQYLIKTATESLFLVMLSNVDEFGFRCSFCSQSLSTKNTARLHTLTTHFNEFIAKIEDYFGQQNTESDPLSVSDAGAKQPNIAPKASKTTSNHGCDICSRSFPSIAQLNKHRSSHSIFNKNSKATRRFKCENCHYTTNHSGSLKYHSLLQHLNYVVSNALPSTYSIVKCTQVVENMVNQIRKYGTQCPWCVCTSNNLKSHLLGTHFDEFVQEVRTHLDAEGQNDNEQGNMEQLEYPLVQLDEGAQNVTEMDCDVSS